MLKLVLCLAIFSISSPIIYWLTKLILVKHKEFSANLEKKNLRRYIPAILRRELQKREVKKFNHQLIDGLILIANALRAGASFSQALETLVREAKPPLSEKFAKLTHEIRLGIPTAQALNNLANELRSEDFNLLVLIVNIARETGGNLSEILSTVAETMRERNKIQGKINALTAQGKMSGLIVSLMPFLLLVMLYFMAPETVSPLFSTLIGNLMLATVIILVALGGFLIKKIVSIDI